MTVFIARYSIATKSEYGTNDESNIIGIFSTIAKAKAALLKAIKQASRDICRMKITEKDLSVYENGDTTEYTYYQKYINGYDDIIATVYAEPVQ